jgi:adenylate cyclase
VRIELPRGTYVPVLRWAAPAGPPAAARTDEEAPSAADDWPTVVASVIDPVLPDPELRDAALRFLDHLAVELGRYGDVRVVLRREPLAVGASPCGDARFCLTGYLSREAGTFCVITRLVDCRSRAQVWAEEYHATPPAVLEERARLAAAAVASEQGVVARRLWAEQRTRPRSATTPYAGILASYQFFFNREPADLAPAIDSLKQVVAAEPECSLAWVQLSRLYTANLAFEVSPLETPVEQAVVYAQNGVRLDPSSQRARCALAGAFLVKGELAAALSEARAALELNPDSLVYLEWVGWLTTLAGDWDRGPQIVRRALARNPHVIPVAHHALWLDHLRRGEMEEAYLAALQYRDPTFYLRSMMRACSLGHLGRREEATADLTELLAKKPDFRTRGRALVGRLVRSLDLLDRIADGLEKAGLALD